MASAPSRAAARLVITWKEIQVHTVSHHKNNKVCLQSKQEDLSAPGQRQLPPKGCPRPRRHPHRFFGSEDASGRRCCLRKNVSSQVMRSSSASTLARRSARPRSCASTPSSSRFNAAVGDATDSVSDCEVGTREPEQEDAAAMATEGVEDWAESEQKRLV